MSGNVLIVFVKRPRPGEVKTRLVPALGGELAADLYRALAEEEVRRTVPRPREYRRLFFFAPAEARAEMEAWFPGEHWLPQAEGDLGARMAAALEEVFRRGARRAAIVGSDVPWVGREIVLEALAALETHDLVVGPSQDGGYYLLALDRPRPELFEGIRWSTSAVLAQTLAHCEGLRVRQLDTLPDVDTLEDLRRVWPRLRPLLEGRDWLPALEDRIRARRR